MQPGGWFQQTIFNSAPKYSRGYPIGCESGSTSTVFNSARTYRWGDPIAFPLVVRVVLPDNIKISPRGPDWLSIGGKRTILNLVVEKNKNNKHPLLNWYFYLIYTKINTFISFWFFSTRNTSYISGHLRHVSETAETIPLNLRDVSAYSNVNKRVQTSVYD